jgi:hypothetical protein
MKKFFITALLSAVCFFTNAQNPVISPNEKLDYEIYYAFVTGAHMTLQTETVSENGKTLYHLVAKGNTVGLIDKIYNIMEDYEAWTDPETLKPVRALKNVRESPKYKRYITYTFDHNNHTVTSTNSGTHKIPQECYDIVAACYKIRMLDMSNLKSGQQITLNTFFGEENWPLVLQYSKTETIKISKLGKIQCYKFIPVVEVSGVFTAQDALNIWISADENKIPIRAQMSLMVGSAKVDLVKHQNLKFPLNFK